MNYITFTEDEIGEREWLEKTTGDKSFETEWTCIDANNNGFYEIPFSNSNKPVPDNIKTVKSVFNGNLNDRNWVKSESLVSRIKFSEPEVTNEYYQSFTLGRVGTIFTEELFRTKFKRFSKHIQITENHYDTFSSIPNHNISMVLTYRKDFWGWTTSTVIAWSVGFHHYNSEYNYNTNLISITLDDLSNIENLLFNTLDIWCNFRACNPNLEFYLLEFKDTINRFSEFASHKAISYNKEDIIVNYNEMKTLFENEYADRWTRHTERAIKHLKEMKCKTSIDFEPFSKGDTKT